MTGSQEINHTDGKSRLLDGFVIRVSKAALQGAAGGFVLGTSLMTWYPDPFRVDAKGRHVPKALNLSYIMGGLRAPMLWGTLACTAFSLVEYTMEGVVNDKDKTYVSAGAAGAAAGLVIGSISRRIDIMAASAFYFGLMFGMLEYNGQQLSSDKQKSGHLAWEKLRTPTMANPDALKALKEKYPEYKDL